MQQFIYYGSNLLSRDRRIKSDYDFSSYITTELGEDESSIKIESVRTLISNLSITSEKPRLIYLYNASLLTLPSQNALLKTLEESPTNTTFIFSVDNLTSLLPTIRSRMQAVKVDAGIINKDLVILSSLKKVMQETAGTRIQYADSLGKDRGACLTWVDSLISSLYEVMQETKSEGQLKFLGGIAEKSVSLREDLSKNVNVGLGMQHFFLSLPQLKSL